MTQCTGWFKKEIPIQRIVLAMEKWSYKGWNLLASPCIIEVRLGEWTWCLLITPELPGWSFTTLCTIVREASHCCRPWSSMGCRSRNYYYYYWCCCCLLCGISNRSIALLHMYKLFYSLLLKSLKIKIYKSIILPVVL